MASLRDQFLSAPCSVAKRVVMPCGLQIWIRPLPYNFLVEVRNLEASGRDHAELADLLPRAAALALCDAQGVPLFDADNPNDLNAIASKPPGVLEEIFEAAIDVSKVDPEPAKKG